MTKQNNEVFGHPKGLFMLFLLKCGKDSLIME